jgi:hypothetical protein
MAPIDDKVASERDGLEHGDSNSVRKSLHDANQAHCYEENLLNLSLLDPSRFGWTAGGGIADLSTPHEVCSLKDIVWNYE